MARAGVKGPRQADIARKAGVSQSTVSMVLAGAAETHRISPSTRRRILEAARQLGYRPTDSAKPAVSHHQRLLGVHTYEPVFPISIRDYYFDFLAGIEEQAVVEGYNLVLFTATQSEDGARRIFDGAVNGLRPAAGSVLFGHNTSHEELVRLSKEGYPFVYIGRREAEDADIAYVGADYRAATVKVVDDLVALGHRRIAYLGEPYRDEPQTDRWDGFSAALTRFGLAVPEPVFTSADALSVQWLENAVADGVTAVVVESARLVQVLGAMAGVHGLSIPRDLSVVVLVDTPIGLDESHPWTAVGVPRNAMGRRAVRLLVTLLNDPAGAHDRHILLPCGHTPGATVARPKS